MMSMFFGSSKKKDPPQVTVDPNPIDGFLVVQNTQPPALSRQLYPNLNNGGYPSVPSSLPYSPAPNIPATTSSSIGTRPLGSGVGNEIQSQLESVPFRIGSHLNFESNNYNNNNNITLNEFTERLNKLKQCLRNGEFEYDFKLERNTLREAKISNGGTVY